MTAIFPNDGVIASQAANTIANPSLVVGCEALWYSTSRCRPAFNPAAANAVIAEIVNAVNCAGLAYDCTRLDNLCLAIKKLIAEDKCLTLANATGCTLRQVVLSTDAAGCSKLAIYNATAAQIKKFDLGDVYGSNHPQTFAPSNPADPATFYSKGQLTAAVNANAIDYTRLDPWKIFDFQFTLDCDTVVAIEWNGGVRFDPAANGGNGSKSFFAVQVDGVFPISPGDQQVLTSLDFTNFESQIARSISQLALTAGTHTIRMYIISAGGVPAQVDVTTAPLPSGGGYGKTWAGVVRKAVL